MGELIQFPQAISVDALKTRLRPDMIAPAQERIETELAPEHTSEPIKSMDDIMKISEYLIKNNRFRDNMLFMFGWAIVYEYKVIGVEDKLIVYPARVKFRGFDGEINSEGYQKVSKWLADNAGELYEESLS